MTKCLCVTKKRGSEFKQHTDRLHDPKRPCVSDLFHIDKTSDLLPDTSLLIVPDVHSMIKNIQVFCSHKPAEQISQHPSPASHIHKNANKYKLPCCRLQTLLESTSFLTTKCSSKIALLLRSSPSQIPLHLFGQVTSATECSSN